MHTQHIGMEYRIVKSNWFFIRIQGGQVLLTQKMHTFDVSVEPVMLIKFAPASVASALARSVFPVPGGPKSNIPLQGCSEIHN